MKLSGFKTIFQKELRTYLNSPTTYIVLIVFLILWEFLFFRNVFLLGEASLRLLMSFVPWLFILLIPALTMGQISEEKSSGTLEILLTHPLGLLELILGKFFATVIFVAFVLAFMFPVAYSLNRFGALDWGVVAGQYFASVLLASVLISLGIFVSSFLASQISALLVASTASFLLIISGFEIVTLSLPSSIAAVFERLSVLSHFDSMSRGVIDLRDIWYFLSAIVIFISLSYLQLIRLRYGNKKSFYHSYQTGIGLFIVITILINIIGSRIPGRLDLTQDQVYKLSDVTVSTLQNLDDVVNIKLFATTELPAQLRPILRDIKDVLHDYQTYAGGKITVSIQDPNQDTQAKADASSLGVQEVQFNVVNQDQLQLKRGYLGLAVSYGGESEVIPLIKDTSDLEYQLTSFIKKLTTTERQTVGFFIGHGEKEPYNQYTLFTKELEKLFAIQPVVLDEETTAIPDDISTLIVAGPNQPLKQDERTILGNYLESGRSTMLLLDGVNVNQDSLTAAVNENSLADLVSVFGINLQSNVVYDLRANETVNFGGGNVNYFLKYPFWPRAQAADPTSPLTNRISSIVLPWPSSIQTDPSKLADRGWVSSVLFTSTQAAGQQTGSFNLRPDQNFSLSNLSEYPLAISISSQDPNQQVPTRIIVVGDSDFLTNDFIQSSAENLAFGTTAVSWLTQEESLAQIQLKRRLARPLVFQDETQPQMIKYINLLIAFVVPVVIGASRVIKRNGLKKFKYSSNL